MKNLNTKALPIELDFKSAKKGSNEKITSLKTFTSYNFERNLLIPASAFRFTAPGISAATRLAIRSCDMVSIYAVDTNGNKKAIAVGIIDETDTHGHTGGIDYVLSGRDMLGQLVDNSAIDLNNKIIRIEKATLDTILSALIKNTQCPPEHISQQVPNGQFLFQTNAGETKINALQRYLEICNCLVWTNVDGRVILGKPDFTQETSGVLIFNSSDPRNNNVMEMRSKRNINSVIRHIVTQLQSLSAAGVTTETSITKDNMDDDMNNVSLGGRSVYRLFTYGESADLVNTISFIGNGNAEPRNVGNELSLREIARDNMKILDIEAITRGHTNSEGNVFNVDQIYTVQFEDDNVDEDMIVYSVSHELTLEMGMISRIRLCRLGTICAYSDALRRQS